MDRSGKRLFLQSRQAQTAQAREMRKNIIDNGGSGAFREPRK
jgi:hypothetical protein